MLTKKIEELMRIHGKNNKIFYGRIYRQRLDLRLSLSLVTIRSHS